MATMSNATTTAAAKNHIVSSSSNNTTTNNIVSNVEEDDLGKLWDTLNKEFENMGKALQCPVCQATINDAVILPCVHAYCRDCILETFKSQGKQENHKCPLCKEHANRRSMTSSPTLNQLSKAYKLALRHFGLTPAQHDPTYVAMTQIAPDQQGDYDNDPFFASTTSYDDEEISYHESSARRKSHKLLASHTQLMVSKTWERVFNKRQQEEEEKEEEAQRQRKTRNSSSGTSNKNAAKLQLRNSNSNSNNNILLPPIGRGNNNTSSNLNAWHRQQQQAVCKSHERVLLDSLRDKQRGPSPTPTIDLSMQQEISYEESLDQELANRQMEEEEEEWKRQEEEEAKEKEEEGKMTKPTTSEKSKEGEYEEEEETVAAACDNNNDGDDEKLDQQDNSNLKPKSKPTTTILATAATAASNSISCCNSTGGTQDCYFTPLEVDSQQSKSTAAPQSLVDMSSMFQASNSNSSSNNNIEEEDGPTVRTNQQQKQEEQEEPLFLSMAESFKTALSSDAAEAAVQEDSQEGQRQQQEQPLVKQQEGNIHKRKNKEQEEEEEEEMAPIDRRRTPRQSNSTASRIRGGSRHGHGDNPKPRDQIIDTPSAAAATTATANNNADANDDGGVGASGATPSSSSTNYRVGSLVQVQDRTWSGINKPGGIARITKVIADAASYDVEYILGGREKNVDALFLSLPPKEMEWASSADATGSSSSVDHEESTSINNANTNTRRGRKSKRISTRVQLIKSEEEEAAAVLPPDLLKQLAQEGFDVTPVAPAAAVTNQRRGRRGGATVRFSAPPSTTLSAVVAGDSKKRSRSESSSTRRPPTSRTRRATTARTRSKPIKEEKSATTNKNNEESYVSKGRTRKKPPVLQPQTAAKQEEKDKQARNMQPNSVASLDQKVPAGTKKTAPNKRRKTVVSKRRGEVPASASTVELCSLANDHYKQRIQEDIDSASICVITTGLSEGDKAAFKALCKAVKLNGGVQIKQSDTVHPKKTTLCLLPASPSRDDSSNLVAKCRTIKGMVCALHGVPLVASSWIQACRDDNNQVIMPSDSEFVRSLPVKTPNKNGFADYGVAKMAVQATLLGTHHVLQAFTAHLCGSFTKPPKADVQLLLREAGAKVSLQNQETVSFLKEMDAGSSSLVLICDDVCASINPVLYRQIEAISKGIKTKEVLVVNPQWLFDSIAAGSALPMSSYPPAKKNGQPFNLFKALQP